MTTTKSIDTLRAEVAAAEVASKKAYAALAALDPNVRATDYGNDYANRVLNECIRSRTALRFARWFLDQAEAA